MVEITERAADEIRKVVVKQGLPESSGLRFGLRDGGCSGYFYLLDFEKAPDEDDIVHEQNGVRVFIHPLHAPFLSGSVITWREAILETGFHVENPNVSRACGCGESVGF